MKLARRVSTVAVAAALAVPPLASGAPAPAGGAPAPAPPGAPGVPAPAAHQPTAPSVPRSPPSPLNPSPAELPPLAPSAPSADLEALMTRLTALQSRIAALGATLFSSTLRIELRAKSDGVRIKGLRVSLDGGVVYDAPAGVALEQPELVYERHVAAGPHVIGVELERQDLRQPEFSSWQASRFVVVVPERQLLWTRLTLDGDSTMGAQFADERAGRYELGVRLDAEVAE